jgi:DNA adenine methylase
MPGLELEGRPAQLYVDVLQLLDEVHKGRIEPQDLLAEIIRWLLINRNEQQQRIESLLRVLRTTQGAIPSPRKP